MQVTGSDSTVTKQVSSSKESTETKKLKAVCKDFEAVFLNMLMSQMRRTVSNDGFFKRSSQEEMMQSMLDTEMTKNMSEAGGIGLSDMLFKQLSQTGIKPTTIVKKGQAPE